MAAEKLIEVKFRLPDGSDMEPKKYSYNTTVAYLKDKIITHWLNENVSGPKTINAVKLITAGKILEDKKTLAESLSPISEIPGGVVTMHVVFHPSMADRNTEKSQNAPEKSVCSCAIL